MRPTLRQFEYILAVEQTGQFSLAAKKVNVSQPSLSAQIADAEDSLGIEIFRRGRQGAVATPAGLDVLEQARKILRDFEDLKESASGSGIFESRLKLGVLPSIGPYLLPRVVRALHRQHPMFRLVVREESTQDLEEGLRSGRLDMIISTPVDHPNSRQSLICQERFWIAVPQDDKLAEISGPVASQDLSGRTLLTVSPKHRLSHIVASLAEQVGGRISDDYEGTSLDAVRLMAAAGSGVAILPQIYASTEARRGPDLCLRLLSDSSIKRDLSLIQPFSREPRTGTDQLVEILKSEAAALISL
jgi:LysR family transcriptional regulator, hydrogen peroxide-inducible genes activator